MKKRATGAVQSIVVETAQLPQIQEPRNLGMEFDLGWVARVQANTSAIERRASTISERRHPRISRPLARA